MHSARLEHRKAPSPLLDTTLHAIQTQTQVGAWVGMDRAMLSIGGGVSDRAWELSHGRRGAFMNQGTRGLIPTPGTLLPS